MQIILGSKSKGRKGVLERMGLVFTTMSADIDEKAIRHEDPEILTLALANAKADALLPNISQNAILITSDQVVVCDDRILEKPENEIEARIFLKGYAFHPAETVTAVVIIETSSKSKFSFVDRAKIYINPLPDELINEIILRGRVYDWAGGFSIEDELLKDYIKNIEGESESIIGLPRVKTMAVISELMSIS